MLVKYVFASLQVLGDYFLVHLTCIFKILALVVKRAGVVKFLLILSFFLFAIRFSNAEKVGVGIAVDSSNSTGVQGGSTTNSDESSLEGKKGIRDQNDIREDTPIDITSDSNNIESNSENTELEYKINNASDTLSYTSQIFRLLLSLAFVIFLAYIAIKFMKKGSLFSVNNDPYLKLVANLNIEQGKSIKIVTVGDEAYIIGVTNSSITKIAKVENRELVDAMNLKADETGEVDKNSFSKVFSNLFSSQKNPQKKENTTQIDYTFLEAQQNRLKNINIQNDTKDDTNE